MGHKRIQAIVVMAVMAIYAWPAQAYQSTNFRGVNPVGKLSQITIRLPGFNIPDFKLDLPEPPESDPTVLLIQRYGPEKAALLIAAWSAAFERKYAEQLTEKEKRLQAVEARLAELEKQERRRQARLRRMRLARKRAVARRAQLARLAKLETEKARGKTATAAKAEADTEPLAKVGSEAEAKTANKLKPTKPATTGEPMAEKAARKGVNDDNLVIQMLPSGPQKAVLDMSLPNTQVCYDRPRVWYGQLRSQNSGYSLEITVKVTTPGKSPVPTSTKPAGQNRPTTGPQSSQPMPLPRDPTRDKPDRDSRALLPSDITATALKRQSISQRRCFQRLPYARRLAGYPVGNAFRDPTNSCLRTACRRSPKRGQAIGEAPVAD